MPVWDRKPEESNPAWLAFRSYRDYGPKRSIDAAWRKSKGLTDDAKRAARHWFIWSSDYKWESRAKEYDAHLEKIAQEAREEVIRNLGKRRAEFEVFVYQDVIEDRFVKLRQTLEKAEQAPITDITRKEEKEVVAGKDGELTSTLTTTKIKGTNLSGYARLNKELRETGAMAVNGPRPIATEKEDRSAAGVPKSVVPEWLAKALKPDEALPETPPVS